MLVFVGTYGEKLGHVDGKGKGVYVLELDATSLSLASESGGKGFLNKAQLGGCECLLNPTYLVSHRDVASGALQLYVVDERYDGSGGIVAAVGVNEESAELTLLGPPVAAGGTGTCHVTVAPGGRHVLAANYLSGSVCCIRRNADGSLDPACTMVLSLPPPASPITYPGPNAARQENAHAHMVQFIADGRTVLVPDLGSDRVWSLEYNADDANEPLRAKGAAACIPPLLGGGPRHLALHPSLPIAYVGYELTSLCAAFEIDATSGELAGEPLAPGPLCVLEGTACSFLGEPAADPSMYSRFVHCSDSGFKSCSDAETSVAAVRITPCGRWLLLSSRIVDGDGAISCVPLTADGKFATDTPIRITSTHGQIPRDFALLPTDERLVVLAANQNSDSMFALPEAAPHVDLHAGVPTPVTIAFSVSK
eukprot:TRINITY_DN7355_c0_g1_i1.p1 TRINITY_DN7355_c0_g1~~TRINITY_DN7355_c0_g1_i1.p1  ORF type:complete len:423 (+),score=62.63 TRINITY_DN7355_c0_g1_i1:85-1353(+)